MDGSGVEAAWWFWDEQNPPVGPMSIHALASLIRSARVSSDVFVSRDGESFLLSSEPEVLKEHLSSPDEIVREYLRHAAVESPDWNWASDAMQYAIDQDPETAWQITTRLIDEAPDDDAIGYFAAIFLEHLVDQHGELLIERVEERARENSKFVQALRGMYRQDRTSDEIWNRVLRITGGEPESSV